jgi:hypothetical protein
MSAKTYSIETLLEGKVYRSLSRKIEGIIQDAEKRSEVWYGENFEAYLVRVRPTYDGKGIFRNDFYATIAVKVGE